MWVKITDIDNDYEVNEKGEFRDCITKEKINLSFNGEYYDIKVSNNGKRYNKAAHIIVAQYHINNGNKIYSKINRKVCFRDGNPRNIHASNLYIGKPKDFKEKTSQQERIYVSYGDEIYC